MGICASDGNVVVDKVEVANSKDVEKAIKMDQAAEAKVIKLLLLGAGESGKSTLFKQMITIYGKGFDEGERKTFTPIIYNNIHSSMRILCEESGNYGTCEATEEKKLVEEAAEDAEVDEALGTAIKTLWADAGIQAAYAKRSKFQLNDSCSYYMGRLDEVMKADYIPSEQDALRSRVPTTGIVENAFDIEGEHFKMFDVGGQRSERKKWIHCFENVTAVLFVASISAYDQVLYEDEGTNRMHEALELFEEITNSQWFKNTSTILFLNKKDLFREKLKHVPLKDFFPEFTGENNFDEASAFVQQLFESKIHDDKSAESYTHITCATDTDNVHTVFNNVKAIIINKSMASAGLM